VVLCELIILNSKKVYIFGFDFKRGCCGQAKDKKGAIFVVYNLAMLE
jgi:hypothetical protein